MRIWAQQGRNIQYKKAQIVEDEKCMTLDKKLSISIDNRIDFSENILLIWRHNNKIVQNVIQEGKIQE